MTAFTLADVPLLATDPLLFDELSIPWDDVYDTNGPLFKALGLANGDTLTTWPSESGSGHALSVIAGAPKFALSVASLNGSPAVQAFGAENMLCTTTALAQPWTIAIVVQRTGGSSTAAYAGAQGNSAVNLGLGSTNFSAGATQSFTAVPGPSLMIGLANGASSTVTVDGTSVLAANAGSSTNTRRQLFSRQATLAIAPLTGYIAFAGFIARDLTTTERANLLSWSRSHYGTP